MTFVRTRTAFGGHHVFAGQPTSVTVRNAVVLGWALYDERRLLVPSSPFMREGFASGSVGLATLGASTTTNANVHAGNLLPRGRYVWIGHIHEHFGHFLVSTLPRLWTVARQNPDFRIITAGPGDLKSRLAIPFIRAIFDALGVLEDRLVEVQDFTVVPEIEVPEPLFVEDSFAWRAFADFCVDLAASIAGGSDHDRDARPLFLTKHKLSHGVRRVNGEELFAEIIAGAGVNVVSPEELTLRDQIRLWRNHSLVSAFEGSALHCGLFVKAKRVLTLSSNSFASSNQALIDSICNHQSLYLNCGGHLVADAQSAPGFSATMTLVEPEAAARSYLSAVDYMRNCKETMRMRSVSDTISPWLYVDEPFGANLSRNKPALVSSLDLIWSSDKQDPALEAAGAVSGRRSHSYQFHTSAEAAPWWMVDLEQQCLITEVRIFNRNDVAQDRARHIVILSSLDGETWERRARREQNDDFGGGAMPHPWRWWQDVPFAARFIKLQLESFDFLHLDQVEVFGMPLSPGMPILFS